MNDDDYGSRLLHPLRGEPARPAAIDVVRAMREGRRLRTRRWWTGGSALAALLAAGLTGGLLVADQQTPRPGPDLPPDPVLPAACTAGVLPTGSHKSAEVTAGDPSGAWLVGLSEAHIPYPSVPHSVLVWHSGELVTEAKPSNMPKNASGVRMNDVNAAGVAVGGKSSGTAGPYVMKDGTIRQLAGGAGNAVAINDAGVIAGMAGPPGQERPVRWASPEARPTPLPLPDGLGRRFFADVADIADDGTIVATVGSSSYLWRPDGTHGYIELPKVEGHQADGFLPMIFSGNGWLVGTLTTPATGPSVDPSRPGSPARDSWIYRYHLPTATWQKLSDGRTDTQVAGTKYGQIMAADPKVFAGRSSLMLPPYSAPVMEGTGGFAIASLSDDARVAAGTVWSSRSDPSKPAVPVIWRCR